MRQKKNTGATVVSIVLAIGCLLAFGVFFAAGIMLEGIDKGGVLDLSALFDKEKEPDVSVEAPVQPQATDDWAAEFDSREANYAYLTRYQDDAEGVVRYNIEGVNGDTSVWLRHAEYPNDGMEYITEIGCVYSQGMYLFVENGMVIALDIATGDVLWENYDFGGYLPITMIDEYDRLYLHCEGDTGADMTVIELATGYTLMQADGLIPAGFTDAKWLEQTDNPDVVRINYASGPDDADNYAFEYNWAMGEMVSRPEVSVAATWQDTYAQVLDSRADYELASLVYIDEDDIPELYVTGDMATLYVLDPATGQIRAQELGDSGSFQYNHKGSAFTYTFYDSDMQTRWLYTMSDGVCEKQGYFSYNMAEEDFEKAFSVNGVTMDMNSHDAELAKFYDEEEERMPTYYDAQETRRMLAEWDAPLEQQVGWKKILADRAALFMESYADTTLSLMDIDGDGVTELYYAYDLDSSIPLGRIVTVDPRTMQMDEIFVEPDNMAYAPGEGMIYNTNILLDSYVTDEVYRCENGDIRCVWKGNRRFYDEDQVTYIIDGVEVAEEEYLELFAQHFPVNNVSYVADEHMTYEQVMAQLQ